MNNAAVIEDIILKEIEILREMLSNLKKEQNALINNIPQGLEEIIEERLNYLEHFESLALKLIEHTLQLRQSANLSIELTHENAIEWLKEIISVENIELHALLGQLEALFEEIDNQCNITHYFLQTGGAARLNYREVRKNPHALAPELKKLQIGVIDPDKEE